MKKETHPDANPVVFVDVNSGAKFYSKSVLSSKNFEEKDGVKYHVVSIEVSSDTHPFYTGKGNIIDSTGRVERFKQRAVKRASK